jgi:hypothetical protein
MIIDFGSKHGISLKRETGAQQNVTKCGFRSPKNRKTRDRRPDMCIYILVVDRNILKRRTGAQKLVQNIMFSFT